MTTIPAPRPTMTVRTAHAGATYVLRHAAALGSKASN